MKTIKPGFFNVEDSHAVLKMNLNDAKAYIYSVIDRQTTARPETIRKAKADVDKARTTVSLSSTVINYMFSHPSEGLAVINPRRHY